MTNDTASFYNIFFYIYDCVDVFFKPQKKRLIAEINQLPHGHLLEIGIGKGSLIPELQKHQLTGIDVSSKMIDYISRKYPNQIDPYVMDGKNMRFNDNQFDYVVLSHVIAVTSNLNQLLFEAERVTKQNGKIFILNHFSPNNPTQHIDKLFNYISPLFCFKSYFKPDFIKFSGDIRLDKKISFGYFNYFSLLIFTKTR